MPLASWDPRSCGLGTLVTHASFLLRSIPPVFAASMSARGKMLLPICEGNKGTNCCGRRLEYLPLVTSGSWKNFLCPFSIYPPTSCSPQARLLLLRRPHPFELVWALKCFVSFSMGTLYRRRAQPAAQHATCPPLCTVHAVDVVPG